MNDILLATNDSNSLHDIRKFLANHVDMKDLGDASNLLDIDIY